MSCFFVGVFWGQIFSILFVTFISIQDCIVSDCTGRRYALHPFLEVSPMLSLKQFQIWSDWQYWPYLIGLIDNTGLISFVWLTILASSHLSDLQYWPYLVCLIYNTGPVSPFHGTVSTAAFYFACLLQAIDDVMSSKWLRAERQVESQAPQHFRPSEFASHMWCLLLPVSLPASSVLSLDSSMSRTSRSTGVFEKTGVEDCHVPVWTSLFRLLVAWSTRNLAMDG